MPTSFESLETALRHHQAGRLTEAETLYRQVLAADADQFDALHLLGVLLSQRGNNDAAIDLLQQAARLRDNLPALHCNLGNVFRIAKRYDEAIGSYRRALELAPGLFSAQNDLGETLRCQGKLDEAELCYRRAIDLNPVCAVAHRNLGVCLLTQKKFGSAIDAFEKALQITPGDFELNNFLGNALNAAGRRDEAIAAYRRAIEIQPTNAGTLQSLCNILISQGRFAEAKSHFVKAVEIDPAFAEAHSNLGSVLVLEGKPDEAILKFDRALELNPKLAVTYNSKGFALKTLGRVEEAIIHYRKSLELAEDSVEAHNNLGIALKFLGKLDEALASMSRAVELMPNYLDGHINLSSILLMQRRFAESIAASERAVAINPDSANAHWSLSQGLLITGDLPRGWDEYEWRTQLINTRQASYSQPKWNGESLVGKTILLHTEQGLGDTIQFIRFAPLVKQLGARVIVEIERPLIRLLANCDGVDEWILRDSPLPDYDFQIAVMSLPRILRTSLDTIPVSVPYIHPPQTLVEQWRKRLSALRGYKIGIHWQGSKTFPLDRLRSFPLSHFEPLAKVSGVDLVSLQQGQGTDQLANLRETLAITEFGEDFDRESGPFMDTAAVMKNLDLIITSDTATAHLAGALGCPVWVVLGYSSEWRWLSDRSDSPWYPTMRLFRQRATGDWRSVFAEIRQVLVESVLHQ